MHIPTLCSINHSISTVLAPQIRALQVEIVIEKLRTKCKNEALGCQYRGDGPDSKRSHESQCELNNAENPPEAARRPSTGGGKISMFFFVLLPPLFDGFCR